MRGQLGDRHQFLRPELFRAFQLLADQFDLAALRPLLRGKAVDLLAQLRDALAQLRLLAHARVMAAFEQLAFRADQRADFGLCLPGLQGGRQREGGGAVLLGGKAHPADGDFIELLRHDLQAGAHQRFVEPQDQRAPLDAVAVIDEDLADRAAGRVLHLLHIAVHDDRARCQHRAG